MTIVERRKKAGASDAPTPGKHTAPATPATAASSGQATPSAAASSGQRSSGGWKWYQIYYACLCSLALVILGGYLTFFRSPYTSHPAYDPLTFLPHATRNQIQRWYQNHPQATPDATTADANTAAAAVEGKNDLPALLAFLAQYQQDGFFDSSASIRNFDHYLECMVAGWIAGVFESTTVAPSVLRAIEAEERGVGSIPGGSRRLREQMSRAVSPIVRLLYQDPDLPTDADQTNTPWSRLTPDHRIWVYEGLSHCHTPACRLAKLQLVSLWQEKVALFPEHAEKDRWTMLTQLFHPETHAFAVEDAPPSADALGTLWMRFSATGDIKYVQRVIELTRLTGARAYQREKDDEIRAWTARKHARAVDKQREQWQLAVDEAKAAAAAGGGDVRLPAEPEPLVEPKLPESPTKELHDLFFNSLLYYQKDHPRVRQAFEREWAKWPQDPIIGELARTKPFRIADTPTQPDRQL